MTDRALLLLLTAVCAWGICGAAVFDAQTPVGQTTELVPALRVATYNVHQWHTGIENGLPNLEGVQAALLDVDADLVGLQETEGGRLQSNGIDGARWLAHRTGMHHIQAPTGESGGYGLALLSRWPIASHRVVELPSDGTMARHALLAVVDHPGGDIDVAVTHLEIDRHPEVRLRQADALLAHIPPGRLVLLGDFNTPPGPGEPPYDALAGSLSDAWLLAGNPTDGGATSPVPGASLRIDHVWVRGWWVTAAGIFGGPEASDHHGVWADLETTPAG